MINKEKYIDFYNNQYTVFFAQQNDIDSRTMTLIPVNGSKIIPLDNSWAVSILYLKPDNTVCFNDGKLNDDGSITIVLTEQMLCVNGKCTAQLILYNPSDKQILSSASFNIIVNESLSTERIESSDEFQTLKILIREADDVLKETEDARDTTYDYMNETETYRDEASTSATTANEAAQSAQQSAVSAASSAEDASLSKTTCEDIVRSVYGAVDNASDYASSASQSASLAKASETNSSESAISASNSATSAESSKIAAATSEANSKTSEMNAVNSATLAENAKDAAYNYKEEASNYATRAFQAEDNASDYAESANNSAQQASASATTAQNYAVGSTESAKYYYEQTKGISEGIKGGLLPHGTVAFAELPDIADVGNGWMYDISDEFVTTSNFKCGAGLTIPAGSNIFKTVDGYWDILAGSPVTGIKGSAESSYRKGNVDITPENIGLGEVGNFKAVSTVASQGLTEKEKLDARNNIDAVSKNGAMFYGTIEGEDVENEDTTWWINRDGTAGGFTTLNSAILKEGGVNLSDKYATKSHSHSEYASANHNHDSKYAPIEHDHDEATTSSSGFMSASDKVDLGNTKNQVNINTQFINEKLCSPTTRNNIFRGEEIPSLAELVSRVHNNFENLYIGDHCKVQFSSDLLFENCWNGTSKVTADVTIAGFNTFIGTGYVTNTAEQRSAGHVYLMEPHAVMVLTMPIGIFNGQKEPILPFIDGNFKDSKIWQAIASGDYDTYKAWFRIPRGMSDLTAYHTFKDNMTYPPHPKESWLYKYVFNTYRYVPDLLDYTFPLANGSGRYTPTNTYGSGLRLYDMQGNDYTDYVLEKPDYLPSYNSVFSASATSKIATKNGTYLPFSSAYSNGNPMMLNVGRYTRHDNDLQDSDIVMSKFNLLSEEEVFGYNLWGCGIDNGHARGMFPLFKLAPGYRCFGGERYWLKNLAYYESDESHTTSTDPGAAPGVHQSVCTSLGMPDADWWASQDAIRFYFLLAGGNKCTIKEQNPQSNYDKDASGYTKGGYIIETKEAVGGDSERYMRQVMLAYGLNPLDYGINPPN